MGHNHKIVSDFNGTRSERFAPNSQEAQRYRRLDFFYNEMNRIAGGQTPYRFSANIESIMVILAQARGNAKEQKLQEDKPAMQHLLANLRRAAVQALDALYKRYNTAEKAHIDQEIIERACQALAWINVQVAVDFFYARRDLNALDRLMRQLKTRIIQCEYQVSDGERLERVVDDALEKMEKLRAQRKEGKEQMA